MSRSDCRCGCLGAAATECEQNPGMRWHQVRDQQRDQRIVSPSEVINRRRRIDDKDVRGLGSSPPSRYIEHLR